MTVSSSPFFPMMCRPMGKPADEKLAGTDAAGLPVAFMGQVKVPFQY